MGALEFFIICKNTSAVLPVLPCRMLASCLHLHAFRYLEIILVQEIEDEDDDLEDDESGWQTASDVDEEAHFDAESDAALEDSSAQDKSQVLCYSIC